MEGQIHPQIQGEGADPLMMKSPDHWPLGAILALKHTNGKEIGVLTSDPDRRWTVWKVVMFDRRLDMFLRAGDPLDMPFEDYDSAEAVYAAGWRVD